MRDDPVRLCDPDPGWPAAFAAEAARLTPALGPRVALHHIGSTAVPGLEAKPIIDILAVAPALSDFDAAAPAMADLGYEAMGPLGIEGRRYFRRITNGVRTHHLHGFEEGSPHVARHLAFRDHLRAHPEEAAAYAALKRDLAARHPDDRPAYCEGKADLVDAMETRALLWAAR